jgi:hypothetical protein
VRDAFIYPSDTTFDIQQSSTTLAVVIKGVTNLLPILFTCVLPISAEAKVWIHTLVVQVHGLVANVSRGSYTSPTVSEVSPRIFLRLHVMYAANSNTQIVDIPRKSLRRYTPVSSQWP